MFGTKVRKVIQYKTSSGAEPFSDWLLQLKDSRARGVIVERIYRLEKGLFGDSKSVGNGVHELRISFGPGYRVYFAFEYNGNLVLLLLGGDKQTQRRDILLAKTFWRNHKERK